MNIKDIITTNFLGITVDNEIPEIEISPFFLGSNNWIADITPKGNSVYNSVYISAVIKTNYGHGFINNVLINTQKKTRCDVNMQNKTYPNSGSIKQLEDVSWIAVLSKRLKYWKFHGNIQREGKFSYIKFSVFLLNTLKRAFIYTFLRIILLLCIIYLLFYISNNRNETLTERPTLANSSSDIIPKFTPPLY